MNDPSAYLYAGIFMLCVAAFFFWNVRRIARVSAESVNWPHVDGQITKSEIREDTPGEKWFLGEFTYAVDRATHKGSINSLGPDKPDFTSMQGQYPVGKTVAVYYRPSRPSENTIEPGARTQPRYMVIWMLAIVGLACFGIAYWKAHS
jgi:hypothetical protein